MSGPYSKEFRRESVALLRSSGKTPPQLAAELGVSPQTLRNWAHQVDVDEGAQEGLSRWRGRSSVGCVANLGS